MKWFGSQNCVDCDDSKGIVCILMHSLYRLTGTGAAFRLEPHFIPYMYSYKKSAKAIDNMGECSYGDMVVSTLWWHLFMLVPLPIWMKGHSMRWHKICNILDDLMQDLDDLMPDLDRIIMHMTKITRVVWNFSRDSMAIRSMLGHVLITPEYNWWTREFYNWRILILGKLVNFAGNYFDSWIDKVSTQWLSCEQMLT